MKILMIIGILAFGDGFNSVDSACDAFLKPLMTSNGAASAVSALNKDVNTKTENPMQSQLQTSLLANGKVTSYTLTSEKMSLGGKMVKRTYLVSFQSGLKTKVTLTLMQPALSSGYFIEDASFNK